MYEESIDNISTLDDSFQIENTINLFYSKYPQFFLK